MKTYIIADGGDRVWTGEGWSLDPTEFQEFRSEEAALNAMLYVTKQLGTHSSVFIDVLEDD